MLNISCRKLILCSGSLSLFLYINSVLFTFRAVQYLGACFRLSEEPRKIFRRVLSLFSLTNWWEERENDKGGAQPQLTTILLVNQGKMTFPHYDIVRERKIFRHRRDLLDFEEAGSLESRMSDAFDKKDWTSARLIYEEALAMFHSTLARRRRRGSGDDDDDVETHVLSLPLFLRRFTRGAVLAYVLTKSVEVLERAKEHSLAVDLLRTLLAQNVYLPHYRGLWYDRLVLDLDMHLKQPQASLDEIKAGLADSRVREGRKLALCQRAMKICNTKKNLKLKESLATDFESLPDWPRLDDTPKVTIQGRLMPKHHSGVGAKTVFLFQKRDEDILCSVEEYTREYYKAHEDFSHGLHGEGAVVNTICSLLFWDVLYDCRVPDAFRGPNQHAPLDFDSDDFYSSRRVEIEALLTEILAWDDTRLTEVVRERWARYFGVMSLVNWELFRSADHMLGLMLCLERAQLAGICRRLMLDHRCTRSGFPDLTLWNPAKKRCVIVEVKGPGDRLSNKQVLWIDYLNKLGVTAVTCHVEAISGKFLPKVTKRSSPIKKSGSPAKNASPKKYDKSLSKKKVVKKRKRPANDDDDDDFVM